MASLSNKVIWVTGASSGIGEGLVRVLAEKNNKLILSSRNQEALEKVKASLPGAARENAKILPLDLSHPDTLDEKAAEALGLFGKIDILIHSGGISQRALALDTQIEVDRRLMEVNYFAAVILTKAVLPSMISNGYGQIISISSLVGKIGSPLRSGYAASKHALHGFFDSVRAETYGKNIYITLVIPGFVKTNVSMNALTEDGKALDQMDDELAKGMTAEQCARKIIQGAEKEKHDLLLGGKETMAVYIKRFYPGLLARIVRKVKA